MMTRMTLIAWRRRASRLQTSYGVRIRNICDIIRIRDSDAHHPSCLNHGGHGRCG